VRSMRASAGMAAMAAAAAVAASRTRVRLAGVVRGGDAAGMSGPG
jgi:hypothetical protein